MPSPEFLPIFEKVREYADADIWSRAVLLTRNAQFVVDQRPDEICVRVKKSGEAVSAKVIFYLSDCDWECDIDSPHDPCLNTVAAAIAFNSGVGISQDTDQGQKGLGSLRYELFRKNGGLGIRRFIKRGDELEEINRPLREIVGGIESGRLGGAKVAVSQDDFSVEAALGPNKAGLIDADRMHQVLKALEVLSHLTLDGATVSLKSSLPDCHVEVFRTRNGFGISLCQKGEISETFTNGAVRIGQILAPSVESVFGQQLAAIIAPPGTIYPFAQLSTLTDEVVPALRRFIEVDETEAHYPFVMRDDPEIDLLMLKDKGELRVCPRLVYGSPVVAESDGRELRVFAKNIFVERNLYKEKQLAVKLKQELNLQLGRELTYSGQEAVRLAETTKAWRTSGEGEQDFQLQGVLGVNVSFEDSSIEAQFKVGGKGKEHHANPEEVFSAWDRGEPYVKLIDGGWATLPEDWLMQHGGRLREFIDAAKLGSVMPAYLKPSLLKFSEELGGEPSLDLLRFRERIESAQLKAEYALPDDIAAELRPYQQEGVNWLAYLKELGIGALLADDMGLGKTLQSICVMETPCLVIAPTSVLPSWKEQIAAFRPSLSVNVYHGAKRSFSKEADILVTSYAVLRNDLEQFQKRSWKVMVLDEAQHIKNPKSQLAQAVCSLDADFKICLSGTPVENSLDDLWSQFQFLNPLLLGSRQSFLKRFVRPIGRGDKTSAQELRERVRPFILRRLKTEVLDDLPTKTESIIWTELSQEESLLYQTVFAATQKKALEKLDQKGGVFAALEALLRLRQAACHPALLPGEDASTSSKVEALMESLNNSVNSGHRALIFSQWTSFLDLIEPHLQARGVRFSRLDGTTKDRAGIIDEFQTDDGPRAMLISLKAGGVGVTLTAADHIYLMDSWWNPAVEEQASGRAHRIGQKNPVFVYRFITSGTVEEKVLALQVRKNQIADMVLSEAEAVTSVSKEEILELLGL